MHFISSIDIFGTNFNFTIFKNEKLQTTFGGILSIISLAISVIFTIFFGRDFFYRLNPKTLTQLVQPLKAEKPLKLKENTSLPKLKLFKEEKLIIPWRIEDVNGLPIDFGNLIYPTLTYYKYKVNSTTQNWDLESSKIVENKRCDNFTGNVTEFYEFQNISNWYCPDWLINEDELGGFWDDNFVYYYEFKIGYCPEAKPYSNDLKCTKVEDLQKILLSDNPYLISILYPKYTFDPTNFENPLQIKFINYYYYLSLELHKTDRIYFKLVTINDDQGWLFTDVKKESRISINRFTSDFSYADIKGYYEEGTSSSLYNLNIYYERDYDQISRSYVKFQNLCADVGGTLKIILTFFGLAAYFYNINIRKNLMLDELFELSNLSLLNNSTLKSFKLNKKEDSSFKILDSKNNKKSLTIKTNNFMENNKSEIKRGVTINNSFIYKKNNDMNYNPAMLSPAKSVYREFFGSETNFKIPIQIRKKTKNMHFGISFIIKFFLCRKCLKKYQKYKAKIFKGIENYLNDRLDVIFYLKNIIKIERFKELFLNKNQVLSFQYLEKEDFNKYVNLEGNSQQKIKTHQLEKSKNESNKLSLISYYKGKIEKNDISDIDRKLLNFLDSNIIESIQKPSL